MDAFDSLYHFLSPELDDSTCLHKTTCFYLILHEIYSSSRVNFEALNCQFLRDSIIYFLENHPSPFKPRTVDVKVHKIYLKINSLVLRIIEVLISNLTCLCGTVVDGIFNTSNLFNFLRLYGHSKQSERITPILHKFISTTYKRSEIICQPNICCDREVKRLMSHPLDGELVYCMLDYCFVLDKLIIDMCVLYFVDLESIKNFILLIERFLDVDFQDSEFDIYYEHITIITVKILLNYLTTLDIPQRVELLDFVNSKQNLSEYITFGDNKEKFQSLVTGDSTNSLSDHFLGVSNSDIDTVLSAFPSLNRETTVRLLNLIPNTELLMSKMLDNPNFITHTLAEYSPPKKLNVIKKLIDPPTTIIDMSIKVINLRLVEQQEVVDSQTIEGIKNTILKYTPTLSMNETYVDREYDDDYDDLDCPIDNIKISSSMLIDEMLGQDSSLQIKHYEITPEESQMSIIHHNPHYALPNRHSRGVHSTHHLNSPRRGSKRGGRRGYRYRGN